jgi:DNA-damage-inducible protein D
MVIMSNIEKYSENIFESIKHIDQNGNEYWYARELSKVLEYRDWRNFQKVVDKAIISAKNSVSDNGDWVVEVNKPIKTGKGKEELIKDYKLSRYICYLIVQNADSSKEVVALGQTYFAVQTRKQELLEEYNLSPEDDKRLESRKEIRIGNRILSRTAINAGVKNLDKFHNAGYKGLYNGETADDIAKRKKIRYREEILDNMGSDELAANLFRISQINQKLIRDNIKGEKDSNSAHYEVGKKVRKAIADIGGIMPEDMPLPNKSLKAIERKKNNNIELTKVK